MKVLISANKETRETRERQRSVCHFPCFICVVWDFHKPSWKNEKMGGKRHHTQQSWPHSLYFSLGASVNTNIVDHRFYHYVMAVIFTGYLLQTIICATGNRRMSLYYYFGQLSWQNILWVCLYIRNCYVNLTVKIFVYKYINARTAITSFVHKVLRLIL
jgi:hypothetical protein